MFLTLLPWALFGAALAAYFLESSLSRDRESNLKKMLKATGDRAEDLEVINKNLLRDREVLGDQLANAENTFEWWTGKTLREGRVIRGATEAKK